MLCWNSHEEIPHVQGKRNPSKMMKNLSHPILLKRIPFCKNSRERASRKSINLTPPPESQSDPRLGPPDFTFRTYDLPGKFELRPGNGNQLEPVARKALPSPTSPEAPGSSSRRTRCQVSAWVSVASTQVPSGTTCFS